MSCVSFLVLVLSLFFTLVTSHPRHHHSHHHHQVAASSAAASSTLALPSTAAPSPNRQNTPLSPLQFRQDGTFQISIFEDLHYGEGENTEWGPDHDTLSGIVMEDILDIETPDFVVLNGDLISGEATFATNSTDYLSPILGPLSERGLTWASTYGNHDSDLNLSRADLYAAEKTFPGSRTEWSVNITGDEGVTNYVLPVYPSNSTTGVPAVLLWFFDSRGGNVYQGWNESCNCKISIDNWVAPSVVSWFETTRDALEEMFGMIPSLAFVHIPTNATWSFASKPGGVDGQTSPGINQDQPLEQQGVTGGQTTVTTSGQYTGQDVPFMSALLGTKGLMGVFSGHDHGDDWCFKWTQQLPGMSLTGNGVNICFGRHSGYGGYGSWTRGARQIWLYEDDLLDVDAGTGSLETWVRLEDGTLSGVVSLNGTFGFDKYPVVEVTYT